MGELTAEERAAIAAFTGKIYRAARGESGLDPDTGGSHLNRLHTRQFRKSKEIDAKIRFLVREGHPEKVISKAVGLSRAAVASRKRRMGLTK